MKKIVKGFAKALFVAALMVLAACPSDTDDPPEVPSNTPETPSDTPKVPETPDVPETPNVPDVPKYSQEMLGEWVRMDTGEIWYFTGNALQIDGKAVSKSISMQKQSARVAEISEGGATYYLYSRRAANASFSGKVVDMESDAGRSARSVRGRMPVAIANKNNPANQVDTETNDDGSFEADGIIIGDEYEVTVDGHVTNVTPAIDGDDIGTITLTEGVNFKASIKPAADTEMAFLYAKSDNAAQSSYNFTLEVENTGTGEATAATYELFYDDDLIAVSEPSNRILGTIESGNKKSLNITLASRRILDAGDFRKIGIRINDPINGKTWEDSVSLVLNTPPAIFYIKSNSPVQGIIIAPYMRTYHFKTGGEEGNCVARVLLPWSGEDFLVAFCGATAATESVYAFGVNRLPDVDLDTFSNTVVYEPNNTEADATRVSMNDSIVSYLHSRDLDYYLVNMGTEPELISVNNVYVAYDTATFTSAIAAINANTTADGSYTIVMSGNFASNDTVTFSSNAVKTVTIMGDTSNRTLSNNSSGALFSVPRGITLVLDNNATLNGNYKSYSVVSISSGGKFIMNEGSKVTGARESGISVDGGTFTMSGGTISGNTTSASISSYYYPSGGGGVSVHGGTFTMSGGTISGNTTTSSTTAYSLSYSYGGGVYVGGGTFTMSGGTISGNTTTSHSSLADYSCGGGVYVSSGTFTMSGGTISGNISSSRSSDFSYSYGGGVYVGEGIFIKTGGAIDATNSATYGKVAYVSAGEKKRNTTAGPDVKLDSLLAGSAGGWE